MLDKDLKYGEASLRARENSVSKVKSEMNKGATDNSLRLLKLIDIVPNWETYLTSKQLEVAKKFVTCMSAYEVDHQLNLSFGTAQQRLFGNSSSKGAIGRLEDVAKKLTEAGYFEKLERKREALMNSSQPPRVSKVSEQTVKRAHEFIKLIVEMPDYEKHLSKEDANKVFQFMSTKSFKKAAMKLHVSELTFIHDLVGKDGSDEGILNKLKQMAQKNMVSNWEDI